MDEKKATRPTGARLRQQVLDIGARLVDEGQALDELIERWIERWLALERETDLDAAGKRGTATSNKAYRRAHIVVGIDVLEALATRMQWRLAGVAPFTNHSPSRMTAFGEIDYDLALALAAWQGARGGDAPGITEFEQVKEWLAQLEDEVVRIRTIVEGTPVSAAGVQARI
jgi:hypothetical protein